MQVIIGVDPHKGSHTAVVVDERERVLAQMRVAADARQVDRLVAFAAAWPQRRWAVEGAAGLGGLLAQQLVAAGEQVVDVPATLSARVRLLSGGSARKTDPDDARAVAIAGLRGARLRSVVAEDATAVLRLLSERRAQLTRARNRTVCRLHALLRDLRPGGARTELSAAQAADVLRRIRPDGPVAAERKRLARELLEDLRRVDRQIADLDKRIRAAVAASGTCLTGIFGVAAVTAAAIIGLTGDVRRFPDRSHYASYNGTAPIEASSGEVRRHRLSRRGNRQPNAAIHMVALTQIRNPGEGRDYYRRKLAEGKTTLEALRALKRQLSNVIYRHLLEDVRRRDEQAQQQREAREDNVLFHTLSA